MSSGKERPQKNGAQLKPRIPKRCLWTFISALNSRLLQVFTFLSALFFVFFSPFLPSKRVFPDRSGGARTNKSAKIIHSSAAAANFRSASFLVGREHVDVLVILRGSSRITRYNFRDSFLQLLKARSCNYGNTITQKIQRPPLPSGLFSEMRAGTVCVIRTGRRQ